MAYNLDTLLAIACRVYRGWRKPVLAGIIEARGGRRVAQPPRVFSQRALLRPARGDGLVHSDLAAVAPQLVGALQQSRHMLAAEVRVEQLARLPPLEGIPEVQVVHTTAGDPDALALLRVRDVDDLKRVIDRLRSTSVVVAPRR